MKRYIQKCIFIIGILGIFNSGYGQFSVSYQHSDFNRIGIGYGFSLEGGGRISAIGVSIGGKGYVGVGYSLELENSLKDFWEYILEE